MGRWLSDTRHRSTSRPGGCFLCLRFDETSVGEGEGDGEIVDDAVAKEDEEDVEEDGVCA